MRKKRLKRPFVPGSDVTLGQVIRQRRAAQRLRYGPVTQQLKQHQVNTGEWFDQYKADLAQKAQQSQGMYADAIKAQVDRADAARVASQQQQSASDEAMRADAASRGATYSGAPGAQASAGTDVRQGLADLFANLIRSQGLAQTDYIRDQSSVGSAAQLSERLRGSKAIEDLKREKGAFRTDYMAKRRQEEARSVLERAAFGLKEFEARERAKPKPKTPQDKINEAKLKFFREHGYWPETGPPKPNKRSGTDQYGNTQAARREAKRKWAKARSLAQQFAEPGDDPSEVYAFLQRKLDADPDILRAASEMATRGYLGPKRYRRLKRLGVPGVPKPKKPKGPYRPDLRTDAAQP